MIQHCQCPTPWDGQPPTLLLQPHKNHPPTHTLTLPPTNPRTTADQHLHQLGYHPEAKTHSWKATVHNWNPTPETPGPRNRPCLHTRLTPTLTATIDTPTYTGPTGHHCPECHTNFENQDTAQTHKPDCRKPCRPPSSIQNTLTNQPLLRPSIDGIWHYNRDSVWPNGSPPPGPITLAELNRGQHPDQLRVPWAYGVSCYARWVAAAVDAGIPVGDQWFVCRTCPGRGDGHCRTEGLYRP